VGPDAVEDPARDPPGRLFGQAAVALDPHRTGKGRFVLPTDKDQPAVKRGLAKIMAGKGGIVPDQPIDPFIAVRRTGGKAILELALHRHRPKDRLRSEKPAAETRGELAEVAGDIRLVEMDETGDPRGIGGVNVAVHPAPDDLQQLLPVQITVDPDHGFPPPLSLWNTC